MGKLYAAGVHDECPLCAGEKFFDPDIDDSHPQTLQLHIKGARPNEHNCNIEFPPGCGDIEVTYKQTYKLTQFNNTPLFCFIVIFNTRFSETLHLRMTMTAMMMIMTTIKMTMTMTMIIIMMVLALVSSMVTAKLMQQL